MLDLADFPDRFRAKVQVDDRHGCWVWTANRSAAGYGYFRWKGKIRRAHRVAWQLAHDREPGPALDHYRHEAAAPAASRCIGPACVRPDHLREVEQRENVLRSRTAAPAVNAFKTHCINGHPLEGDNLYVWRGHRICRTCRRANDRRYYAARATTR